MEEKEFSVEYIIENGLDKSAYGFVYVTTNMVNGKKYIGQKMFRNGWKGYLGSGVYFKKAVKSYGKDKFLRVIVEIVYSREELDNLEIELIKRYNAVENDGYYNISYGGGTTAGIHMSEEVNRKNSERHRGEKNYFYGKTHTEETLIIFSKIKKGENNPMFGSHHSETAKLKISVALKEHVRSEEHKIHIGESKKGKMHSKETKLKMSNSHLGHKISEETKDILRLVNTKINEEQRIEIREKYITGNYTQSELGREYNVTGTTISDVINYRGIHASLDMKNEDISKVIYNRRIICLTTGEIFNSQVDALNAYNINTTSLSQCCNGIRKSAGRHPETNEKMVWMFYNEYIKSQSLITV